jgi:hypothetical protein
MNTSTSAGASSARAEAPRWDVPYYLSKYAPDPYPLRVYLTATAPETRDTEACPEGLEGVLLGRFRRAQQPMP